LLFLVSRHIPKAQHLVEQDENMYANSIRHYP
jgi:hypothetical protein